MLMYPLQDIYSLFHLDRPFKFISKTSNFVIPIVGWSMFLTGKLCSSLACDSHYWGPWAEESAIRDYGSELGHAPYSGAALETVSVQVAALVVVPSGSTTQPPSYAAGRRLLNSFAY